MARKTFREMLEDRWGRENFVCVGLDPVYEKLPKAVCDPGNMATSIMNFNARIVDATKDLVCAYKPNSAFYEALGKLGMYALRETVAHIREAAPDVPVILDAKRGDIGNTNEGYVRAAFDYFEADAITVNPYLGAEALQPFLDKREKGIFVLCRTSNPGAGELQDLQIAEDPLYLHVARHVARKWNKWGNCALVVGATCPDELAEVRREVGDLPILIPGIGAQGGELEKTVRAGRDSRRRGMLVNSSRGVLYASRGEDYAAAARHEVEKLRSAVNACR